jgi:hypothetical protein
MMTFQEMLFTIFQIKEITIYLNKRLRNLPKRFKRELKKTPGFEYFEMPGCAWYDDYINEAMDFFVCARFV